MIFKISFQKHCIFLMGPTILWFFRCGEHNLKNLPNSLKKEKKKKKIPTKQAYYRISTFLQRRSKGLSLPGSVGLNPFGFP